MIDFNGFRNFLIAEAVSAFVDWRTDDIVKVLFHVGKLDTVLRTFRSSQARYNRSEINSITSENSGSGVSAVRNMFCAL